MPVLVTALSRRGGCCCAACWLAGCPGSSVVSGDCVGSLDFLLGLIWILPGPLLPSLLRGLSCLLPTCMSIPRSNHDAGVELHITLPGDLRVSVSGPSSSAARAAELLGYISLFEFGAGAVGSDRSFELVSNPPESVGPPTAPVLERETRETILRSFDPCPGRLFSHCARLCGSSLSGKERIERAWLAGQWAGAVRSNRIGSPNRTPTIDLRPRFYAVLRASGLDQPTVFRSSAGCWSCIGSLESSNSISQSFPSEIEAKIYLEAAGAVEVDFAP